jgi:hypothetical protein
VSVGLLLSRSLQEGYWSSQFVLEEAFSLGIVGAERVVSCPAP